MTTRPAHPAARHQRDRRRFGSMADNNPIRPEQDGDPRRSASGLPPTLTEAAIELEDFIQNTTTTLPSFVMGQILSRTDDVIAGRVALERALQRATRRGEVQEITTVLYDLVLLKWFQATTRTPSASSPSASRNAARPQ
jgi:hypothetical protein